MLHSGQMTFFKWRWDEWNQIYVSIWTKIICLIRLSSSDVCPWNTSYKVASNSAGLKTRVPPCPVQQRFHWVPRAFLHYLRFGPITKIASLLLLKILVSSYSFSESPFKTRSYRYNPPKTSHAEGMCGATGTAVLTAPYPARAGCW